MSWVPTRITRRTTWVERRDSSEYVGGETTVETVETEHGSVVNTGTVT